MSYPVFSDLTQGEVLFERECTLTRDSLVRYAGASGDFNPIHYRDDFAVSVGLEGVLAHGMLTMGLANAAVADWLGSAGVIVDTQTRFSRPIWVDAQHGAAVNLSAKVNKLDDAAQTAQLMLQVLYLDKPVLAKALVSVRFNQTA